MSNSLIAPIYNEVRNIKGLLNEVFASDMAFNFLLGLAGSQDGPLLESWLQDPVNLSGFNQVILDPIRSKDLLTLDAPMRSIANSQAAINVVVNNAGLFELAMENLVASNAIMDSPIGVESVFSIDSAAVSFLSDISRVEIALTKGYVVEAISSSSVAVSDLISTAEKRGLLLSSQVALDVISSSSEATHLLVNDAPTLNEIVLNQDALNAFVFSRIAMDTICSSELALSIMFSSRAAKITIFESQNAELAIRNSSLAITYLSSIATQVTVSGVGAAYGDMPDPVSGQGKWLILGINGGYVNQDTSKNVRSFKFGQESVSFTGTYMTEDMPLLPPYDVPPVKEVLSPWTSGIEVRFYTQTIVRLHNTNSNYSTFRQALYINMSSEGAA